MESVKTILFFSRANLPQLYGKLSQYIKNVQIIHVAYSQDEVKQLESFNIKPDYIYLDLFREEYDSCVLNEDILKTIDNTIIEYSDGRFNLNSAIQSDRGFSLLTNEESLRSAVAHYNVWTKIFARNHVDIFEHEPCSLFFNYIASILCKKQGGVYCYQLAVKNDKYEFAYMTANNGEYDYLELKSNYKKYINNPNLIDKERCSTFLRNFREDMGVFLGNLLNRRTPLYKLCYWSLREKLTIKYTKSKFDRIYSNIEYWSFHNKVYGTKLDNLKRYKQRNIKFEASIPEGEKYLFYPFHLEPEAVVQYLADGIYKNQVKLIENIAASLPPGCYLYVKDHPHAYAYRNADDYERLMKIPNIRLLNQNIPGKAIIKNSVGVVTINGSAGFEALLMGKQVYCFGTCMYSFVPRVNYVKNIRDLRDAIYQNIDVVYKDDTEFYAYVMAVLESSHSGYIGGFVGGVQIPGMDMEENAKEIAEEMVSYANHIDNYKYATQ